MKKIWILLCTLAALTVAMVAAAACPYPTGSSGGNGWVSGHPQTYIYDVKIHPLSDSILIVNACDYGTSFCAESNISFQGKVHFHDINGGFHAYPGTPLRRVVVSAPGCTIQNSSSWCITFVGDTDVGDHINEFQNATMFYMDPAGEHPTTAMSITAPFGWGVVKFAGMGSNPAQTLRINYVNSSATGIATGNFGFTALSCQ